MSLEVFFDGSCRFCHRQAKRLKSLSQELIFIDISTDPLYIGLYGIEQSFALEHLCVYDEKTDAVYTDSAAVLLIIKTLGYGSIARLFSTPVFHELFVAGYWVLSKTRKYV